MAKKDTLSARLAQAATEWTGSSTALCLAVLVIIAWLASGPFFGFSDTWQLVINTSTTIVTFLMVFLIQRTQNKDSQAIQLKLNELVAAMHGASNRLIAAEDMTEADLAMLRKHFRTLSRLAARDETLTESHSIEEAAERHERKQRETPC